MHERLTDFGLEEGLPRLPHKRVGDLIVVIADGHVAKIKNTTGRGTLVDAHLRRIQVLVEKAVVTKELVVEPTVVLFKVVIDEEVRVESAQGRFFTGSWIGINQRRVEHRRYALRAADDRATQVSHDLRRC